MLSFQFPDCQLTPGTIEMLEWGLAWKIGFGSSFIQKQLQRIISVSIFNETVIIFYALRSELIF
jgi:hypothetical protein